MSYYLGIDIGGTFTDGALLQSGSTPRLFKTPTTKHDLLEAVREIVALAAADLEIAPAELLADTSYFGIGTTTATNALIERKGARTGLITTRGFADTLLIQRTMGQWAGMGQEITYYSRRQSPPPLIPRHLIAEVIERVDYKGEAVVPLDEDSVVAAIDALVAQDVEAIAVSLLWSFRHPAHEQRIREIAADRAPDVFVTLSSELAPVIGEYERTATVAVNAYLGPLMKRHFDRFESELKDDGLRGHLRVMNSGGGVMPSEAAGTRAVSTLVSGPTGGVLASLRLAEVLGHRNVITTDTGGTSFDVSLIVDGRPLITSSSEVGKYHIVEPMLNIQAIGAGGGSIARVEHDGLHVGPTSAGADPGPACYGRGGTQPTVTDADVVLGYIDPDYFLGGRIVLDRSNAQDAVRIHVAEPLGMSVEEAAAAIKTIADNQMADLVHALTIGKGYDPRDFAMYAYGGAGPTHCHAYGAELGVAAIVVPASAEVHSAFGVGTSDLQTSAALTDPMRTAPFSQEPPSAFVDADRINANFARLEAQAREQLVAGGDASAEIRLERYVDMRYRRQVNELLVPAPEGTLGPAEVDALVEAFDVLYEQRFGRGSAFREAGVELVTFRAHARAVTSKPSLERPMMGSPSTNGRRDTREVYFASHGQVEATVARGEQLAAGSEVVGPAVIEFPGTTVVVGPGQRATLDALGNTVLS
jgi:N-methylhydantoinase A